MLGDERWHFLKMIFGGRGHLFCRVQRLWPSFLTLVVRSGKVIVDYNIQFDLIISWHHIHVHMENKHLLSFKSKNWKRHLKKRISMCSHSCLSYSPSKNCRRQWRVMQPNNSVIYLLEIVPTCYHYHPGLLIITIYFQLIINLHIKYMTLLHIINVLYTIIP